MNDRLLAVEGYGERPLLLDLFSGAGGAARGYYDAGFAVIGVDLDPKPLRHYPFPWLCADALETLARLTAGERLEFSDGNSYGLEDIAAIHASPPCQAYSDLAKLNGNADKWPRLVAPVRDMLIRSGLPYVIENVEGAPLQHPVVLCGTMFPALRVLRHRLFEAHFEIVPPPHGVHPKVHTLDKRKSHYGKTDEWKDFVQVTGGGNSSLASAREAMGISWVSKAELNQAIPPAYCRFIGQQLLRYLEAQS